MNDKITLAMQLYQEPFQVTMAFYCNIHNQKEGYMFIHLDDIAPEKAFWVGLQSVLSKLSKQHLHKKILLAFSPLYIKIGTGNSKASAMHLLSTFKDYEHIPYDQYRDCLDKVNTMGKEQKLPRNHLQGYTATEFQNWLNLFKPQQDKVKKVTSKYYTGAVMPTAGACFDLETTTTIIQYARVIEFGAVKFDNGHIMDSLHSFVNPKLKIPKKVRELTGISQRDVDNAPNTYNAIKSLVHFLKDCRYLVGHNVIYDFSILSLCCERFGLPQLDVELICTQRLAKQANLIVKNYKLETLLKLYGIKDENPHRALSDAIASFNLMKKIYDESFLIS